jgi:Ca-activated chloride channel family protein
VGIVVYGSRGEVRLPLTDVSGRETILGVIDELQPGGSTNAAEGLELGYRLARGNYDAGVINRVILCSDGVANTGDATDAEGILALVRRASDEGITLSTVGFGMGNYNDVLMEKLADQGDGNYFYVDRPTEAARVFRENLTGLLQTIAREAKVQVEFDPRVVTRWRLLGYENRDVADRDFRNDAVDAGEVGAGHQVTALYEVKLIGDPRAAAAGGSAGTVRLRWEAPAHDTVHAGQVTEIEKEIPWQVLQAPESAATPHRRAQALAAEFAEVLRGSYWAKGSRLADLVPVADALAAQLPDDAQVQDLRRMIRQAADLQPKE